MDQECWVFIDFEIVEISIISVYEIEIIYCLCGEIINCGENVVVCIEIMVEVFSCLLVKVCEVLYGECVMLFMYIFVGGCYLFNLFVFCFDWEIQVECWCVCVVWVEVYDC